MGPDHGQFEKSHVLDVTPSKAAFDRLKSVLGLGKAAINRPMQPLEIRNGKYTVRASISLKPVPDGVSSNNETIWVETENGELKQRCELDEHGLRSFNVNSRTVQLNGELFTVVNPLYSSGGNAVTLDSRENGDQSSLMAVALVDEICTGLGSI